MHGPECPWSSTFRGRRLGRVAAAHRRTLPAPAVTHWGWMGRETTITLLALPGTTFAIPAATRRHVVDGESVARRSVARSQARAGMTHRPEFPGRCGRAPRCW